MRDRQSGRLGYRGESLPLMSSPVRLQRLPTNVCTLRPAAAAYFAYIEERRDLSLVMGEIPKRNFPIQLTHDRFIFTSRNNNPKITKKSNLMLLFAFCAGVMDKSTWAAIILSPFTFSFPALLPLNLICSTELL